ncbi:PPP4R2-domain-containing protein [Dissophora ornata]|nr:PPP4R2-domain-containing protein [Dissophora ornata]
MQLPPADPISVPWEELRTVLKQRLDHVLESKQLTYTAPTVTNPLTTKLTPLPSTETTHSETTLPLVGTSPSAPPAEEARVATEDQDQAHVPEQGHEQNKEGTKGKDQSAEQEVEHQPELESGPSQRSDKTEGQAEGQTLPEGSAEQQQESNSEGIKTAEAATNGAAESVATIATVSTESGPKMVPISKDTLLVETPEGYHGRIDGLLDAFASAPFTIQRVCELLSNPTEHHSNLIKYLRAVEKVLMITSSINEFSNPAYNGPSALDENKGVGSETPRTVNGDYSGTTPLDFNLITVAVPSSEFMDTQEQNESMGVHNESALVEAGTLETEAATTLKALDGSQGDNDEDKDNGMDVEKVAAVAGGSDMELDPAAGSAMDGVESEDETESQEGEDSLSDIQVDAETDEGMELDQA